MTEDSSHSLYLLKSEGPRPHVTEYSCEYGRFVGYKQFPIPGGGAKTAWRKRLRELAKDLMEDPIPGLADLHEFKIKGGKVTGVFEVLPGRSLDAAVEELGGLPAPLFLEVVQQLLETVVLAYERGEIEFFFDPRSIYIWRVGEDIFTGFAACEFHVGHEHETSEWVHWLRQLAIVWFYAATGEWVTSYYNLVDRDLSQIPQLAASGPIAHFFDRLFHSDIEKRIFDLERLRELIVVCDEEIGMRPIHPSAMRVLDRLPHKRICLSWIVSEEELPSQYTLAKAGRDSRRPTMIPARDEFTGRSVFLHILPPPSVAGKTLLKISDQAERLHDEPKPNRPVLPIVDSWEINGCRVYAESMPDGPSLAEILDRVGAGLPLEHIITAARKIDAAIRSAERGGLIIPSLHPADVFLISSTPGAIAMDDFDWLRKPGAYVARLRALPTGFLHLQDPAHYQNDHKAVLMRWIIGFPQEVRFSELVARLLSHRELTRPTVKFAIQRASLRHFRTASWVRASLLGDLSRAIGHKPGKKPTWRSNVLRPFRDAEAWRAAAIPKVPAGLIATAAALVLTLALGLSYMVNRPSNESPGAGQNPYMAEEISTPGSSPPKNLLPVSGDQQLLSPQLTNELEVDENEDEESVPARAEEECE
ncbi:MAG: hypothetical protein ACI8UO_001023 [Verrucomicrobiales bacterium]|jgi:hypothetical protein